VLAVTNGPPEYTSAEELPARFGRFGGRYIPETLAKAHEELEAEYIRASRDVEFRRELETLGRDFIGR
jgi:tryptophan synthase beta chain